MSLAIEILSNNKLIIGSKYKSKTIEKLIEGLVINGLCPHELGLKERKCTNQCRNCWQQILTDSLPGTEGE